MAMEVSLSKNKIGEILSRGIYWKEVVTRDGFDGWYNELREVSQSIGAYPILAILNNYAEEQRAPSAGK